MTQYEAEAPTLTSDRVCKTYTPLSFDAREVAPPTPTTDRIVVPNTVVCTSSQFELYPRTFFADRACQDLTVCEAGYDAQVEATPTSDRLCKPVAQSLERPSQAQLADTSTVSTFVFVYDPNAVKLYIGIRTIGTNLIVEKGNALRRVDAGNLVSIGAGLDIEQNGEVTVVSLPSLTWIGSTVTVFDNPHLHVISLPALQNVGGSFVVCQNHHLFTVPPSIKALWSGLTCAVAEGAGACPTAPATCS